MKHHKHKLLTLGTTIVLMALSAVSIGQSLAFDDLINLQRNDLEKAKGYFNYKGWKWTGTNKDCHNCLKQGGYDLEYDKTTWTNNQESIQLLQHGGHANVMIYFPAQYGFNSLEKGAKDNLTAAGTGTRENGMWNSYRGRGLKFTFNTDKVSSSYSGRTTYNVIITNEQDVKGRIDAMCSRCKGKGQINETQKCSYCSGDGRKNCKGCKGKGKLYCNYCKDGKVKCNTCYGKSTLRCNKCYGKGSLRCSKCYGKGEYNCTKCYGKGTVTQNVPGFSFQRKCTSCSGKGKFSCGSCSGKGSLQCQSCAGVGNIACTSGCAAGMVTCQRCSGRFSSTCGQCSGSGNTDLVCSSCSGTGNSSRKIKKVCPKCDGTKRSTPQRTVTQGQQSQQEKKTASGGLFGMAETEKKTSEEEKFYTMVEDMPSYPGGNTALLEHIAKTLAYPPEAKRKGITGVVYVSYIVDSDGSVKDVKVVRGTDPLLDKEAVRVIRGLEGYTPGRQRGKAVPVQFTIPIRFKL